MKQINFGSIHVGDIAKAHINDCFASQWFTMGPKTKLLEERWCKLFNYKHAKFVSSGTAGITACCMALYELVGAQPFDEVICPALSFIASGNGIRAAGLIPVFVDVDWDMNIDVRKIEEEITEHTRAILAVNLMGRPAQLDIIQDIARRHNLVVIVDNCEAYGCQYKGKYALEYGDMEVSSHFAAHIIQSCEGSMCSTNSKHIAELIESIRNHGRVPKSDYFQHDIWGLNFKNTDLHACIGLETFGRFHETFAERRRILNTIYEGVKEFSDVAYFTEEDEGNYNAPHGFSITLKKPGYIKSLQNALDAAKISWKRNFGSMPTQHGCFKYLGYQAGEFPVAEYIGDNGIHLGASERWTKDDVERIVKTLRTFLSKLMVY
jgi:dTDP-4-amino-4,6-dideoxygalactose transaminase